MSWTSKMTANLGNDSTVNATQRARAASSAAAANATSAAHSAALAAQHAASLAQTAAQNAAVFAANAASAARSASGAAQTAASGTTKGVKRGVYTARSWAAPRLDSAADYTTATVAPRVSAALRTTARRVSPPETSSKRASILAWSVLGAAALAALGAGAAVVRSRYRAAIAADSEAADEEIRGDSTGSQPAPASADGTRSATATSPDSKTEKTEMPVNKQVSSSDR